MKNTLTAITLATTIVIGTSFIGNYSYAESTKDLNDIQDQRKDIKEDLSETESKVTEIISEIDGLNHEIERVNQIIIEKQALIDDTEKDINNTISEVNELQDEIKELEESIEKRYDILKNRVSSYQQAGGSVNYLEVIFGSESFGDFISRVSTVTKIVESDTSLMEQLEDDIKQVEENQQLALEKLDQLNTMKLEQEEALNEINEQKQQNEQSKEALESKRNELTALVEELESKDRNLASMESEVKQSIEAAKQNEEQKSKPEQTKVANATTSSSQSANLEHKSKVEDNTKTNDKKEEKTFTVTSTAYTVQSAGGSGITYTGINLRKNPNTKVIAVDPSVIPLGSVVHVEGYGYAIAGDIGSAIKGKKIDVYVPTQQAAKNWGVRKVKVTIQ
ncbi:PcsB-like coiled-coil domain-containing protein [Oceanobacillus salinisoli]|uniref:PcsB-like coiled-coil domain-containing protein n=1 Tax=Oceanobacillus salinisoli TaxID=2678611 RepID=UPI0012E1A422|nr:3D domain-containing protein [Oceanobacillus salinisoli]